METSKDRYDKSKYWKTTHKKKIFTTKQHTKKHKDIINKQTNKPKNKQAIANFPLHVIKSDLVHVWRPSFAFILFKLK